MAISFEKLATLSVILIVAFNILDTFVQRASGNAVSFSLVINAASWLLLGILVYWTVIAKKKHIFIKVFLALVAIKWFVHIAYYQHYSFQKEMLIFPLLVIALSERSRFRVMCYEAVYRYRYALTGMVFLTLVPFLGSYSAYAEEDRFSGLWSLPQAGAYYCLAVIIIFLHKNIILCALAYMLMVYTGGKSAMLAGVVLISSLPFIQKGNLLKTVGQIAAVLGIVLFMTLGGGVKYLSDRVVTNFSPLVYTDVTNSAYGNGRVFLNLVAIDSIRQFSGFELLFGKSATEMYQMYERLLGSPTWPHNDFVTGLYCNGILGLIFYCYFLFVYPCVARTRKDTYSNAIIGLSLFILAATNGFYTYLAGFVMVMGYRFDDEQVGTVRVLAKKDGSYAKR